MASVRRTSTIVVASVVALGVAAAAFVSAYQQFATASRITRENVAILTLTQASLATQPNVRPPAMPLESWGAALSRQPMDAAVIARAGLRAAAAGNAALAGTLMTEALRRDPRSVAVRLWLLMADVKRNDASGAVDQLDRLMIIARDHREAFFPALAEVMKQPRAESAVAAALGRKPEWRDWFLRYLTQTGQNPALVFRLTAGTPNDAGVKSGLIQKLVDSGQYDAAYLAWINFLPENALAQVAAVYDGGFAGLAGPQPFNWTFDDSEAASVGIEPGQGLQIDYPAAQTVRMASQTMVLKPGRYRLDYTASGSAEAGDGGVVSWRIACLPTNAVLLDAAITGLRDQPSGRGVLFVVPDTCKAQLLSIEGIAGTFPQSRSLAIHRVAISPVSS